MKKESFFPSQRISIDTRLTEKQVPHISEEMSSNLRPLRESTKTGLLHRHKEAMEREACNSLPRRNETARRRLIHIRAD